MATMAASTSTTAVSALIPKNMMCQSAVSTTMPPTVGPMAGANAMTRPKMPMAAPRFSTGKLTRSTVMDMGMRMPAPMACTRRPARSTGKFGVRPHMSAPTRNSAMENRNSRLVENRSCR